MKSILLILTLLFTLSAPVKAEESVGNCQVGLHETYTHNEVTAHGVWRITRIAFKLPTNEAWCYLDYHFVSDFGLLRAYESSNTDICTVEAGNLHCQGNVTEGVTISTYTNGSVVALATERYFDTQTTWLYFGSGVWMPIIVTT